jgi:hypothetical protein
MNAGRGSAQQSADATPVSNSKGELETGRGPENDRLGKNIRAVLVQVRFNWIETLALEDTHAVLFRVDFH